MASSNLKVFLSYARRDSSHLVKLLHDRLSAQNFDPFVDMDLMAGEDWVQVIEQAVIDCDVFIPLLSQGWIESSFAQRELALATERQKQIIPVLAGDVMSSELPLTVTRYNWVDMRDIETFERGFQVLLHALEDRAGFASNEAPLKAKQSVSQPPAESAGSRVLTGLSSLVYSAVWMVWDAVAASRRFLRRFTDRLPRFRTGESTQDAQELAASAELDERQRRFIREFHFFQDDRPEGEDQLDYTRYADAFEQIVRSELTEPPLTVGIYASWGAGKSFLMRQILNRLRGPAPTGLRRFTLVDVILSSSRYPRLYIKGVRRRIHQALASQNETEPAAFIKSSAVTESDSDQALPSEHFMPNILPVEFDAWIYAGSDNLWASLITHIYDSTTRYYGLVFALLFRLRYMLRRSSVILLLIIVSAGAAVILVSSPDTWIGSLTALAGLVVAVSGALTATIKTVRDFVVGPGGDLNLSSARGNLRRKIGFMANIKKDMNILTKILNSTDTRLVLFIDDLDRCPPKKAVEVLEAIMLLLSEQEDPHGHKSGMPIIIFIGMDARIMVKAIEDNFGEVLRDAGVTGYEYLDKIVQIPFRIPPPKDEKLVKYVDQLLRLGEGAPQFDNLAIQNQIVDEIEASEEDASGEDSEDDSADGAAGEDQPVRLPGKWDFVELQWRAFDDFKSYLSRNPRRIKRIVNIYRLVHLLSEDIVIQNPRRLIKWIILCEQWPFRMAWILQKIEDDIQSQGRFYSEQGRGINDVYETVRDYVYSEASHPFVVLDGDPEQFDNFIQLSAVTSDSPVEEDALTVRFIHEMRYFTFNLNPAMQSEVLKDAVLRTATPSTSDQ